MSCTLHQSIRGVLLDTNALLVAARRLFSFGWRIWYCLQVRYGSKFLPPCYHALYGFLWLNIGSWFEQKVTYLIWERNPIFTGLFFETPERLHIRLANHLLKSNFSATPAFGEWMMFVICACWHLWCIIVWYLVERESLLIHAFLGLQRTFVVWNLLALHYSKHRLVVVCSRRGFSLQF